MSEITEKNYELRPLTAADFGTVCKIISLIGVRQFKECFKVDDLGELNVQKIGFNIVFDIAGIIISNIPKAESDIQAFLASMTGMSIDEVKELPFADYGVMIIDVVMKDEFKDFFKRVMKLFNL